MHYILYCTDKPGHLETRLANRESHLAYVSNSGAQVKMAGPYLDDSGAMIGSLIIIEADNFEVAQSWADNDPYALAGLFSSVALHPFKWVVNPPQD